MDPAFHSLKAPSGYSARLEAPSTSVTPDSLLTCSSSEHLSEEAVVAWGKAF